MALLAASFAALAGLPAQALERHPARILPGDRIAALPGVGVESSNLEKTPFGVDLSGIEIVSNGNQLGKSTKAKGVLVQSDNPDLTAPALANLLRPYIGQPLSQYLLGEVRTAITKYMRGLRRPLVAVYIPPQEVTSGAVQILVIPFKVGEKRVERVATGYKNTPESYVLDTVHAASGDEINSDQLLADLNWLNVGPFRKVGVVFAPGKEVGTTNLILRLSDLKPWQVYGGYANSGTSATYLDRLYAGIVAANVGKGDQQFSYQFTASPQTLNTTNGFLDPEVEKAYLAHSMGIFLPLPWRHKLTARAEYIAANSQLTAPFFQKNRTFQTDFDYAVPVMQANPSVDVFAGGAFKRQSNEVLFGSTPTGTTRIDVVEAALGVRGHVSSPHATTDFSVKGIFSPGGLTPFNHDADYVAASGNPGDKARFAYGVATANTHVPLPKDFSLEFDLAGQIASNSLPSIEQFGIGGIASVRGYETNEYLGDDGLSARAEFHLPAISLSNNAKYQDRSDIYAFLDYGLVHLLATDTTHSLLGAGVGIDVSINKSVHASLAWGHAFSTGATTRANSDRIHASLTAFY